MFVVRYNPLALLTKVYLDRLIQEGHIFFVRQSYPRGLAMGTKEAFLFTPYNNVFSVNRHIKAIREDPRALVYNIPHTNRSAKALHSGISTKWLCCISKPVKGPEMEVPERSTKQA